MTDNTRAKLPRTTLNVEYVTLAGTKMVPVQPEGDKVTVGDTTAFVPRDRIGFDKKKGGAWCRIAEGNPVALPLFAEGHQEVTARQLDQTAHNNLLEQLNNLAKANKPPAVQWLTLIVLGVLGVVMVGIAVSEHNDMAAIKANLAALQPHTTTTTCTPSPGQPCDATAPGSQQPQAAQPQQGCIIGTPNCPR